MFVGYCPGETEVMAPLHQDMMCQCCRNDGLQHASRFAMAGLATNFFLLLCSCSGIQGCLLCAARHGTATQNSWEYPEVRQGLACHWMEVQRL